MATRYRQRSWLSTGYWTVSLAGLLVLTAYQFEWPPFSGAQYSAVTPDSPVPGPGEVQTEQELRNSLEVSESVFQNQLEPPPNEPSSSRRGIQQVAHESEEPNTFRSQEFSENGLSQPQQFGEPPGATQLSGTRPPKIDRKVTTSEFDQFVDERRTASTPTTIPEDDPRQTAGSQTAGVVQTTSRTPDETNENYEPDFPEDQSQSSQQFNDSDFPEDVVAAETDPQLLAIDALITNGKYIDAHRALSKIYWKEPGRRRDIQKRIEQTAKIIYFSPQPHFMKPYTIEAGDRLARVSKLYRVPWQYLEKLNNIDARRIREGQKLKVIKGPFAAVVDLKNHELTLHSHGYFVRRYRIGTGRNNSTPIGKFTVLNKVTNPQYTDPNGQVVEPDDPQNPLGEFWIDLGDSYGIHGTIDPSSIGRAESAGCVRMADRDIEEVYDMLTVGSQVIIRP